MRSVLALVTACVTACVVAGCTGGSDPPRSGGQSTGAQRPTGPPSLTVTVVADGLDHPWDVAQAPDGTLLTDERGGGFTVVRSDGRPSRVAANFDDLFARGETGLMGLVLDPGFADNRRFYTCQGRSTGSASTSRPYLESLPFSTRPRLVSIAIARL